MQVKGTGSWCALVEYVKDNYYARFYDPSYHATEKDTLVFYSSRNLTKSMKCEMKVKGTGSRCVLVEYVKDNYYARLHDPS